MRRPSLLLPLLALALPLAAAVDPAERQRPATLVERTDADTLRRIARQAERHRAAAEPLERSGELLDVRTVIHAHSHLSHDSDGTPEEILAAARQAGVRAIFMTDHYAEGRRHLSEALRGERDGVLFIAGTELPDGLLVFRADDVPFERRTPAAELLARFQELREARGSGPLAFLCHPELREDWDLPPFPAMEIYNTHADVDDHREELDALVGSALDLPRLLTLLRNLRSSPEAGFAAIFDPPALNLQLWDRFTQERKVTGFAGSDSHQNTGFRLEVRERNLAVVDRLGNEVAEFSRGGLPPQLFGRAAWRAGDVLIDETLDPYPLSFGYVSTHLLVPEVTEAALFEALLEGRAYVAFDWLADPGGFSFTGRAGEQVALMGGDLPAGPETLLEARASLPCEWRLIRNGVEVRRTEGREFRAPAAEPGVYRLEAWLDLGPETRPWIYSNPIYIRPALAR